MKRWFALLPWVALACGAKTGLDVSDRPGAVDASVEATIDAPTDTGPLPCTPGLITLERAQPTVMMVLDRSGSMGQRLGGTTDTRWQILTRALAAAMPAVDKTMRIGALVFPSGSGARTCNVNTTPELEPATGNVTALIDLLRSRSPAGGTPTADAIENAATALLAKRAARAARALVLATDGAPVCNFGLDPKTCRCGSTTSSCAGRPELCLDDKHTVEVLADYASRGAPTYVIGIAASSAGGFPDVLDAMAIAGGRPKTTGAHKFYGADSESELDAALIAIRDQVGACNYLTLSVPDREGAINVLVDGVVVPYDESGMNGWRWVDKDNGQIEFSGAWCSRVAGPASALRIEARVECSDGG
jgi:hypothetical protein